MAAIAIAALSAWGGAAVGTAIGGAMATWGLGTYMIATAASIAISSVGRSVLGLNRVATVTAPLRTFSGQVSGRPSSFGQPQQAVPNNDFSAAGTGQTTMIRSAVSPRRVVYGRAMLSGPVVFVCSSAGPQPNTVMYQGLVAETGKRTVKVYAEAGAKELLLEYYDEPIAVGTVFHFRGDKTDYTVEKFVPLKKYAVNPTHSDARTVATIKRFLWANVQWVDLQSGADVNATVQGEKIVLIGPEEKSYTATIIADAERLDHSEAPESYTLDLSAPVTLSAGGHISTSVYGGEIKILAVESPTQIKVSATDASSRLAVGVTIYDSGMVSESGAPIYADEGAHSAQITGLTKNYPTSDTVSEYTRIHFDGSISPNFNVQVNTPVLILSKDSAFTGEHKEQMITFKPGLQNAVYPSFELDIDVVVRPAVPSKQETTTRTVQHQFLHLVIPLCEGEVDAIEHVYLDGVEWQKHPGVDPINGVKYHLGQAGQLADTALMAASKGIWTAAHRLQGITYIYVKLGWDPTAFPNGIPNIKALVRGKKVTDPRNPAAPPAWSENWALCMRDYLMADYGLNCPADEIDDTHFSAAATIADDAVPILGGTQARYTCNGTVDLTMKPQDIIDQMITAGAGMLTYTQGKFALFAGYHVNGSSVLTLDESGLRGAIQVNPKLPRRDMFNGVKGQFIDASNQWQLSDFPTYQNPTYAAQDGETIIKDIQLPYTNDPVRAQRLAKIILERGRNAMTVTYPAKLVGLQVAVGDSVALNIAQLGFAAKEFLVVGWAFSQDGGVDLSLIEISAAVYDWAMGEQTTIDLTPNTNLPPRWLMPPLGLRLSEELKRENNNYVTVCSIDFSHSPDARSVGYEIQYAVINDSNPVQDFITISTGPTRHYEYRHIEPCRIAVRVRAVSAYGARSNWIDEQIIVHGPEGYISAIGLPDPVNPGIAIEQDREGHITRVRFSGGYHKGDIVPDGVAVYFSITDHLNAVQIASGGTSSTLLVAGEEVLAASHIPPSSPLTIRDGSTVNALVVTDAVHPLPDSQNIYGMVWFQTGAGQWRKATRNDATTIFFEDEPLDVAPTVGASLNWAEIAWVDNREAQYRLGYIADDAGNYEVIRWGSVEQVGVSFYLDGCARGQEGTTPINADGKSFLYFPAAGKISESVIFPTTAFSETSPGLYTASADKEITWKRHQFASVTCCTFVRVGEKYVRSRLVPLAMWGAL